MLHRRSALCALALIAGLPLPRLAAAQAVDKQAICRDLNQHPMTVGTWATYNWTGGQQDGSTLRFAVIGVERQQGKTYYWLEMILDNAKSGARSKMIMQLLTPGLASQASDIRSVIMKTGNQPAMRLSEQMVRVMASALGTNLAADIARECQAMDVVGWEQVTVPAGSFRALHLRHVPNGTDVWVQLSLHFGMVKTTMRDGGMMTLTGQGTGAKSSITETPQEMPGFPAPPPRQ